MELNFSTDISLFHYLLHHLPVNLRRFVENYLDLGQNRKAVKGAEKPEISGFAGLWREMFRMVKILFICHGRIFLIRRKAWKFVIFCVSYSDLPTVYQYFWRVRFAIITTEIAKIRSLNYQKMVTAPLGNRRDYQNERSVNSDTT